MKRVGHLYEALISYENLGKAIDEVNNSHHWRRGHKPNPCTAWVQETKKDRIKDLRRIITEGFVQKPPRIKERYDASARKTRIISEPIQWPDQYVHHALIQVLQPVMMRGMDHWCCGSIKKRGSHHAMKAIKRWMNTDVNGTKYELSCDIYHFYDSLKPEIVLRRMKNLVKDWRALDLIWRVIKDGVKIGAYTSQWFANTTLQPLDHLIRQSGLCSHYERHMDNLTVFGSNRRKTHKLKRLIDEWLDEHGLRLKDDWQVFPIPKEMEKRPINPPRHGFMRMKCRLPDAVGYRFGRGFIIPRKHNYIRMKRRIGVYKKRRALHKAVTPRMAESILSRLGQLAHCNNHNLYQSLFEGQKIIASLKGIVRKARKKEELTWSMYLEQRRNARLLRQKQGNIPT